MSVPVSAILGRKGADVITAGLQDSLRDAAELMARNRIGALVVSPDGRAVRGMISERDVVRCLAEDGPSCLDDPVSEHMTADVITCDAETTADELMAIMTQQRIRHVPVLADSALIGIVSIGDVVKSRLDELEVQTETLRQYVTGSSS